MLSRCICHAHSLFLSREQQQGWLEEDPLDLANGISITDSDVLYWSNTWQCEVNRFTSKRRTVRLCIKYIYKDENEGCFIYNFSYFQLVSYVLNTVSVSSSFIFISVNENDLTVILLFFRLFSVTIITLICDTVSNLQYFILYYTEVGYVIIWEAL